MSDSLVCNNQSGWFLYMIRCRNGNLYTGITTDVDRRLAEHAAGRGSKFLRGKSPLTLVFSQPVGSHSAALKAELAIKRMSKACKEKLICSSEPVIAE
ncbi:MAG: GIY-YIG nuclease family protein [Mariprofundaceae bacterium]|nr:GIY-YIG nuclease family protein [Mariprofundaceae bacterium]